MKTNKKKLIILILLILFTLLIIRINKFRNLSDQDSNDLGIPVEIVSVKKGTVQESIEYIGIVDLFEEITIFSRANGLIEKLPFEIGDRIKKDTIIGHIDREQLNIKKIKLEEILNIQNNFIEKNTLNKKYIDNKLNIINLDLNELNNKFKEFESLIEVGKINLNISKNKFERNLNLYNNNVITQSEFEIIEASYLSAIENLKQLSIQSSQININKEKLENEIKQLNLDYQLIDNEIKKANSEIIIAKQDIRDINLQLDYTQIKTKFNSVILEKYKNRGEFVMMGQEILKLGNDSKVKIIINIPPFIANKIGNETDVIITFDTIKKRYMTKLIKKNPEINRKTGLISLEFQLDNIEGLLKKGMSANVKIILDKNNNTLKIPNESIIKDNNNNYVFVIQNNIAEKRKIYLGIQGEEYTEIIEGLLIEEKIVTNGKRNLKNNDKIFLWRDGEKL